jgi:hypothetical protein
MITAALLHTRNYPDGRNSGQIMRHVRIGVGIVSEIQIGILNRKVGPSGGGESETNGDSFGIGNRRGCDSAVANHDQEPILSENVLVSHAGIEGEVIVSILNEPIVDSVVVGVVGPVIDGS